VGIEAGGDEHPARVEPFHPGCYEVVERAQGLLDRRPGIADMLIVKVDAIGVEPLQAGLDGMHDIAPRRALEPSLPVHRPGKLGGEHNLVAPSGEGAAEIFLRGAALAIGVRGVEKIDAEVERLVHDRARRFHAGAAAEIVAPQPDRRDDEA